ncbi:MAG: SDR family oxidoreductase [Bacteroidia bacterium]
MNLSLQGKHALVCGSTQGIGRASAFELAGLGARITLLARNEAALHETCEALPPVEGGAHDYLAADFAHPDRLGERVQQYLGTHRRPFHILVNNTGGPPGGPIADATIEAFLAAYQMHLVCNHLLVQALLPGMQAAGYGRIINIISTSVKIPIDGLGVSNTTRGAVASWAKTLANELGPQGITVNNVLPGFTETGRLAALIQRQAEREGRTYEAVAAQLQTTTPARRFAQPEEVAAAVAFLASPAAAYINGINLPVDGGRTGAL